MKSLIGGIAAWTGMCLAVMFLWPGYGVLLPCMRLVGRSADCDARQEAINRAVAFVTWYPEFTLMLGGYLVIAAAALVSFRRRQRS